MKGPSSIVLYLTSHMSFWRTVCNPSAFQCALFFQEPAMLLMLTCRYHAPPSNPRETTAIPRVSGRGSIVSLRKISQLDLRQRMRLTSQYHSVLLGTKVRDFGQLLRDLCEGGSFLSTIFQSDIKLSVYHISCFYICFPIRRFVEGNICRKCAHCFV